jgi:hypothetical protein
MGVVLLALPLAAHAQLDSRGGVTVAVYVNHNGSLDGLHVTIRNDNSYSVSQIAYVIQ